MKKEISFEKGQFITPNEITIPYIEGDGIGSEITTVMRKVVDNAIEKSYNGEKYIQWQELLAGKKAFEQTGSFLPKDTIELLKKYRIGIKGPLETPIGGGIRSLNVALRQVLDLYVCLRPIRYFEGVSSPVKNPEKVKMTIFRENTEDIYAGIEYMIGTPEAIRVRDFFINEMGVSSIRFPKTSSFGLKPVSKEGSERLIKAAINYAINNNLPSVTLVHKGNIMKYTEGAFKKWGYDLVENEFSEKCFTMRQYGEIKNYSGESVAQTMLEKAKSEGKTIIKDVITDAFLQETLLRPKEYSVVATMNLNGDYISDQLAAMVGGIGISPGANINYSEGYAIFEATHGTAPTIVGLGKANPCSLILSATMMLEHIGWQEASNCIIVALETLLKEGKVTSDLYDQNLQTKLLSTSEFGDELIKLI